MLPITPIVLPSIKVPAGSRPPASPFQFFLLGNEAIRIRSWNTAPDTTIRFVGRFVNAAGEMSWLRFDHTPNTDASLHTTYHPLGEGFLINASVFAASGSPRIGQTFVQVQVVVGDVAAATRMGTLLQGYVTQDQELAYPGSPIQNSLDGGGFVRSITHAAPGIGDVVSLAVPAGVRWEVLSVITIFFTGATVANRRPFLGFTNGVDTIFLSWTPTDVPANLSKTCVFAQGMPLATEIFPGNAVMGLGYAAPLLAGHTLFVAASNIQATDQFGGAIITVREWIEAQ